MSTQENIQRAKKILEEADALFITAGAGMGVDSGLPDFRGTEGVWNAYPKARELNLKFEEMANPQWFESDPGLAWAFYGHRLHLYRETVPHEGFRKLLQLSNTKEYGSFVFTSNVDGQFQKAGFSEARVMECHGSIHHLQCLDDCQKKIWSADDTTVAAGEGFKAEEPLPKCPWCGGMARPNILMFDDWGWNYSRTNAQRERIKAWIGKIADKAAKLAIVEMGAGTAVPTVRNTSEKTAKEFDVPLIRISPAESFGAEIALPMGAKEALDTII
ncbi:MAG: Sir2 family NAD-dependent protein deacetylase [Sulfurimonas sp.]